MCGCVYVQHTACTRGPGPVIVSPGARRCSAVINIVIIFRLGGRYRRRAASARLVDAPTRYSLARALARSTETRARRRRTATTRVAATPRRVFVAVIFTRPARYSLARSPRSLSLARSHSLALSSAARSSRAHALPEKRYASRPVDAAADVLCSRRSAPSAAASVENAILLRRLVVVFAAF